MRTVLIAPFDPVTSAALRWAKDYIRIHHLKKLYLLPWGEGVLSGQERKQLLEAAVKPYRKLAVAASIERDDEVIRWDDDGSEEQARSGRFVLCDRPVRAVMNEKGYYYQEIARVRCNPHRYAHSLGVAETAKKLAHAHHLDEDQAYKAGLLHDITKALSDEEGRKIIAAYQPSWLMLSPKVWHSYTAVVFCRQEMDMHDEAILHAIEHHTIGDGCTDLDRILYIADKIEPGRGYDASKELALSLQDLKAGSDLIKHEAKQYIYEKEGIHV
jgi:nicotinate-nucleotide adenylyltransferase